MSHRYLVASAFVALIFSPFAVQAGALNYRFVEVGYLDVERSLQAVDVESDIGLRVGGSWELGDDLRVTGEVDRVVFEDFVPLLNTDASATKYAAGLGITPNIAEGTDFLGDAQIIHRQFRFESFDDDSATGARVRGGVRTRFAESFEGGIGATIEYIDQEIGRSDSTRIGFDANLHYYAVPDVASLFLGYEYSDNGSGVEEDLLVAGVRVPY